MSFCLLLNNRQWTIICSIFSTQGIPFFNEDGGYTKMIYIQESFSKVFFWQFLRANLELGLLKLRSLFSPLGKLLRLKNTRQVLWITLIFHGLHINWAAETPIKYVRDIQYTTSDFTMTKNRENNGTEGIGSVPPPQMNVFIMKGIRWTRFIFHLSSHVN